jgi:hypothetical protein
VETEPTFSLGQPETLFRGKYYSIGVGALGIQYVLWDIHPADRRFLMIKTHAVTDKEASEESTPEIPRKINIVVNWFEELKERVPVD